MLGEWAAITPREAAAILDRLSIPWWLAGGWALELTGDAPRPHGDLDIAVLRPDHERLRLELPDWDLRVAYRGVLEPWQGGAVGPPQNAVWARPSGESRWWLDIKLEPVDGDEWVFRRDPTIRYPVEEIGDVTGGIRHLRREILELYVRR